MSTRPEPQAAQAGPRGTPRAAEAALYALLGLLSLLLFHRLAFVTPAGDFLFHVNAASGGARGAGYPPHFLYHLALNLLGGIWGGGEGLLRATVLLLTAATVLKIGLTRWLASRLAEHRGGAIPPIGMALLLAALFFAGPAPNWWAFPRVYLGQFTPNVWHNPTTIAAMPLALAVVLSLTAVGPRRGRARAAGAALLATSVLMKPNFALTLLPVLALLTALGRLPIRDLALYGLPTAACLGWLFLRGFGPEQGASVELRPLAVWLRFTDHPFGSLLVSFAFPLGLLACYARRLRSPRELAFAWLLVAVALAQFLLLAEGGARAWHGNFVWAVVPALYLLFLASAVELVLQRPRGGAGRARFAACCGLLALHVLGGAWMFGRFWLGIPALAA